LAKDDGGRSFLSIVALYLAFSVAMVLLVVVIDLVVSVKKETGDQAIDIKYGFYTAAEPRPFSHLSEPCAKA